MAWFRGLFKRLESTDPQALFTVIACSTLAQYFAFYSGMKFLIFRNFDLGRTNHQLSTELTELLTDRTFALNTEQPKALMHQVITGVVTTSCITYRYPLRLPVTLCAWGCMASAYLAWSPIIHLLAISAELRDGNNALGKHFSLMAFRQVTPTGIFLAQSTMVALTWAMWKGMAWRWALPGSVIYLMLAAFL